jgi:hypothetical protein
MVFKNHSNLEGTHAPFSASKSSWLRYTDEKIVEVRDNMKAKELGTRLHEWAAETIELGIKMPKTKKTINAYINDAIGFNMTPEVVLFYSMYFYGTADAINYNEKTKVLRIHDLKTGKSKPSMKQLEAYAALFILEYAEQLNFDPMSINIELRIYQIGEPVLWHTPENSYILDICEAIKANDKIVKQTQSELFLEE